MYFFFLSLFKILLQQIKALLQSVGTSFCPDYSDWFGDEEAGDTHSRNADKSVLSKFLQSHPADYSTTKLQVLLRSIFAIFQNVNFHQIYFYNVMNSEIACFFV